MLDRSKIGHEFPTFNTTVEKGRLKFFAEVIGETNPIYTDEAAARAAGYRNIPAPPTFPFSLDFDGPEFLPVLGVLDLDINRVLHGGQDFDYFEPICAGDEITVSSRITDMYDKKGGALEFVVIQYQFHNQDGALVAKSITTTVYRNQ